jgi:galactokinase
LPPSVAKRARHVISENERVLAAVEAMKHADLPTFGRLMNASHESLRSDFEVSGLELDTMVEIARQQEGCYGARLTGAGFGGCTVNLVRDNDAPAFAANVARAYREQMGVEPPIYVCRAMPGAGVVG